ncbi:MAG: hypothetical protein QW625_01150 [Candidatus Nanoarchaeia archaeon]
MTLTYGDGTRWNGFPALFQIEDSPDGFPISPLEYKILTHKILPPNAKLSEVVQIFMVKLSSGALQQIFDLYINSIIENRENYAELYGNWFVFNIQEKKAYGVEIKKLNCLNESEVIKTPDSVMFKSPNYLTDRILRARETFFKKIEGYVGNIHTHPDSSHASINDRLTAIELATHATMNSNCLRFHDPFAAQCGLRIYYDLKMPFELKKRLKQWCKKSDSYRLQRILMKLCELFDQNISYLKETTFVIQGLPNSDLEIVMDKEVKLNVEIKKLDKKTFII